MGKFHLQADYTLTDVQEQAAEELAQGVLNDERYLTLLGVTGSGKTFAVAATVEKLQRPTLVIAHNKTLAAQLYNEFREFFPDNAVEYFVSYYDYYQPEAYVPSKDLYIEKDSAINEEIERLRHSATAALLSREDVLVVSSVSCIYGLGDPASYQAHAQVLGRGMTMSREQLMENLTAMRYDRNDLVLERGNFRVRGDRIDIYPPASTNYAYGIEFFGDEIETIQQFDPLTGQVLAQLRQAAFYPATHYTADQMKIEQAMKRIFAEMEGQENKFTADGKLIEAQRIKERTMYDLEMMSELGYCNGIENYAPVLEGRAPGERPSCLIDYFPPGFLCFVDESHQTLPQIRGMHKGDRSRKETLVNWGFRLPSALDNRPQTFDEFIDRLGSLLMISATPGEFERENSSRLVEQVVRPTGILDPEVTVVPTEGQIDHLLGEIRTEQERGNRVLVTTLTKKMAEDLTDYVTEYGVRAKYLHSDIDTIERIEIIRSLRLGEFDVLVGVNLLREGLDLPEVSLVAILDADKEGFLRGETALIQTVGRAARHIEGRVIMYADKHSRAMKAAIEETARRRDIQIAYNKERGIVPTAISKGISDLSEFLIQARPKKSGKQPPISALDQETRASELVRLEEEMLGAAEELRFEEAARIRDQIKAIQTAASA